MARVIIILAAFIVGLCIVSAVAAPALPPHRPDCKLLFVEVQLSDPALDAFTAYAPLYLCSKVEA